MFDAIMYTPSYVRRGILPLLGGRVTLRRNAVSDFDLTINGNETGWERFETGYRIVITETRDGEPQPWQVLAGTVTSIEEEYAAGVRTIHLIGVSDMAWLSRHITYPDPSRTAENQTADAYWKRTGNAETVIRDMVRYNLGPQARAERRDTLTLDTNRNRGANVTLNTRYKNVLEEAQALALAGGVTFETRQDDGGSVFGFRDQRDMTRRIRLGDENEAVESWKITRSAPEVTSVIVAGQGQGADRNIKVRTGNQNTWGVVAEEFRDRRDTDDDAELIQAGDERLEEGREKASVTFELVDLENMRFGWDYFLGDRVGVYLSGAVIEDLVQLADISFSETGRAVKLQVGPVLDEEDSPRWVREVKRIRRDMRGLEGI